MKLNRMTIEQVRERMGAETTTKEAARMVELLKAYPYTDLDEIEETLWFELVALAISK